MDLYVALLMSLLIICLFAGWMVTLRVLHLRQLPPTLHVNLFNPAISQQAGQKPQDDEEDDDDEDEDDEVY